MKAIRVTVILCFFLAGCEPLERQAYNTVVGAGAFIKLMSAKLPGCSAVPATMTMPQACAALQRARAAKDLLIDAMEVYCAGPRFDNGGACDAPKKGEPGKVQAMDKLRAALNGYTQAANDLKGAIH